MAKLINPFDDPNFDPSKPRQAAAAQRSALKNPFDDPSFNPGEIPTSAARAPQQAQGAFDEFLSASGSAVKGEFRPFGEFLSGQNRRDEDLPVFTGEGLGEGAKLNIALGTLTTADPQKLADIVKSTSPGFDAQVDKFGNVVVVDPQGQRSFLNKPGLDTQDVTEITGQLLQFVPAARLAGLAKGLLPRVFGAGAGEAATEFGRQAATEGLGSEQGVTGTDVALAGVGGAGGEALAPIVSFLAAKGGGVVKSFLADSTLVAPDGAVTPKGEQVLVSMGFDPTEATAALTEQAARAAEGGLTGQTGQRVAEAGEFGIPLTSGQATGDIATLQGEEAFRSGARGGGAQRVQTGFDVQQREAIDRAAGQQIEQFGAGEAIERPRVAGQSAIEGIRLRAETLDREISDAYDLAGSLDASFDEDAVTELPGFVSSVMGSADVDLDSTLTPAAKRAFDLVGEFSQKEGQSLSDFERLRRKIGFTIGASANPSDKRAATIVKRAMDQWADAAVDDALIDGGQEALDAIKNARGLRRRYGVLFERDAQLRSDRAGKIIERFVEDDLTPEEAVNHIIGSHVVGARSTSALVAKRVKDIVGEDSPEWGQLRQAALMRMFKATGTTKPTPGGISKSIKQTLEGEGESFSKVLFTTKERAQIRRFGNAVQNADKRAGLANPSGSGFTFFRELLRVAPIVAAATQGPAAAIATTGLSGGKSLFSSAQARRGVAQEFGGKAPLRSPAALGAAVAVGSTQGQQQ